MEETNTWAWFEGDPGELCENEIVRDACKRGATIKVLSRENDVAKVRYKDEVGTVPVEGLLAREPSAFCWGEKVLIPDKGTEAIVDLVCWHFNEGKYYYYLKSPDGRPVKKRYFSDELEGV